MTLPQARLMMLASDPNDDELVDIARRVGTGTPATGFLVETWTTTDELRQKIEDVGAKYELTQLDLVGHGSWGTFGLFPANEVVNCYYNGCELRRIGESLASEVHVRVLACDFATPVVKAGGWKFDPQTALRWVAGVMRTQKNARLQFSAPQERIPPDAFDATGFNPPSRLQLVTVTVKD